MHEQRGGLKMILTKFVIFVDLKHYYCNENNFMESWETLILHIR